MPVSSIVTLACLLLIVLGVIFRVVFWPAYRLRKIYQQEFPASWRQILHRRLPFSAKLPAELSTQLEKLITVFIHDKSFVGCAGLEITDEIRVTIAAQACVLLLNRSTYQYKDLRSILVYPSAFVARRAVRDELGLVSENHTVLLGESWSQGKVVLAWDKVEKGVCDLSDGHNVVFHEFAHQLDSESGTTDGAPILNSRGAYSSWSHVFSKEFLELQRDASHGHSSLLDHYGATNPAEFFAVATETFFEQPKRLRKEHRALFDELSSFYQLDPSQWLD